MPELLSSVLAFARSVVTNRNKLVLELDEGTGFGCAVVGKVMANNSRTHDPVYTLKRAADTDLII
jgi:hypothetical protein